MNVKLTKDFYSSSDIAGLLGVNLRTVQNWMNAKGTQTRLRVIRIGRTHLVARDDLHDFLTAHYDQSPEPKREKYRTKSKLRGADKFIAETRKQQTDETLRRLKVIQ